MKQRRLLLFVAAALMAMLAPGVIHAQSSGELRAGYEKYWQEDIAYLKKINGEKDGHRAALLVAQMKEEMLPKLQKQLQATDAFKKAHSGEEVKQEQEWSANNPLQKEAGSLQTDLMINGSRQGGEMAGAVGDYMKSMSKMMRKPRQ